MQDHRATLDIPKKRSSFPLIGMAPARGHLAKWTFHTVDKINRDNVLGMRSVALVAEYAGFH